MNTLQTAGAAMDSADALKELIARQSVEIEQLRMALNQEALARENVSAMRQQLAVEIERKKAVLSKAHDALAFAYNDCESDYVRDEKIDPAMDAIQKELT